MTDLAPAPAPASLGAPSGNSLEANLNTVLKAAPELGQSPGLAVGVATSGADPELTGQSIARGATAMADSSAKNRVAQSTGGGLSGALNWFGNHVEHYAGDVGHDFASGAEQVGSAAMNLLNKPLSIVQHEYRYLHDVEASHGMGAAIGEGIGIAAGAAAGFAVGGTSGAILGAELTTGLESQVFYRDSWQRTASASYVDPHTHQQVSLGRDVVSFLASHGIGPTRGTIPFDALSGAIDGIFDMSTGGGEVAGLVGDARSAEGSAGLLGRYFTGTAPQTPEDLANAYNRYSSVKRAFQDIASKSAGEIAATPAYQSLRHPGLLQALGDARTGHEVADVFASALGTHELAFMDTLPTLTRTRYFTQALRELAENAGGPIGRVARGFTRLPESFLSDVDGKVTGISAHEFDPSDPNDNGAIGLYRMLRYTETRETAAQVVDAYLNEPELANRVKMFRNATMSTLFQMGGLGKVTREEYLAQFLNPNHQKAMAKVLDDLIGGGAFGKEAIYGLDRKGNILGMVRDAKGTWQYGAAITDNQTGKLRFLDLGEARRAAKMLQGAEDILGSEGHGLISRTLAGGDLAGRLDDFAYHHITQGIFKPLVLLTPSYALHISLAELIPNTLRLGVLNMVRDGLAINFAKLGDKALLFENGIEGAYRSKLDQAVSGMAWRMVDALSGGRLDSLIRDPTNLAKSAMGRRIQLAARYIEYNDGYAPSALLSGHYSPTELGDREEIAARLMRHRVGVSGTRLGETFRKFGEGEHGFIDAWQAWLKEIGNDRASQIGAHELWRAVRDGDDVETAAGKASSLVAHFLRNQPKEYLDRFLRSDAQFTSLPYRVNRLPGMDQFDDWAKVKIENMLGATTGSNGTTNLDLLDRISGGEWAARHDLERIDRDSRPAYAKGQELVPDGSSKVQRIANVGFHRVLNPMVNFLSRQPIAFAEFERQYELVRPLIESGKLDEDEAMSLAMSRTVQRVIRNVHNIYDRTQWTTTLRNWAPFYFAQEQAYRRGGRLLAENPQAFRKYALMIANLHDVGQIFQGPDGNGYFVLPGTGWMTSGVARAAQAIGLPVEGSSTVGMGWNLSGMNVVFPLSSGARPDLGPLVAIPVQAIANLFPELGAPAFKGMLTAGENAALGPSTDTEPIWNQVVPNVIAQRVLDAIDPNLNQRSFNSTMMQVLQTLDYEHKIPAPDAGPMAWQTFIDRVRNQTRVMYLMKGLVGAVTPVSPELTDPVYNQFSSELDAAINSAGSVNKGITEFLSKNPDATPFTVFQSYSPTGASIPESVQAENWIDANQRLIDRYPYSAFYFMPQPMSTTYNETVYNEQLAQGYRVKYNPNDADVEGDLGSSFLAQLYIAAGNSLMFANNGPYDQYKQVEQNGTSEEKYQAYLDFNQAIMTLSAQNPVWGAYWAGDTRESDRTQAVQEIQQMIAAGDVPRTAQTEGILGLMKDYATYKNQLQVGLQNSYSTESQGEINQQWENWLDAVAATNPNLRPFIQGVFISLPPSIGGS